MVFELLERFMPAFRKQSADVVTLPDTATAARSARERAARESFTVLALGGLFLAAEIQRAWQGGDPQELEFF